MKHFALLLLGAALNSGPAAASPWPLSELYELRGQEALVTDTTYTPDGAKVLSCDRKGTIYAWNPNDGTVLWHLEEPEGNFSRVTVSRDGRLAAVVGLHFVGVIDLVRGTWLKRYTLPNLGAASAVAISDSDRLLAVGDSGSHIWLIDMRTNGITDFAHHDWGIMDLRFTDHDQFLLAGDATSVRIWDVEERTDRRIVDTEADDIPGMYFLTRMTFTEDAKFVIVGSGNDAVLFNLAEQVVVQSFHGHDKEVVVVRVTPDHLNVVTSSRDHTTRVWDIETGEVIGKTEALDLSLTASIAVSPKNDQFIMSAALFDIFGGTVRTKLAIWAIPSRQ